MTADVLERAHQIAALRDRYGEFDVDSELRAVSTDEYEQVKWFHEQDVMGGARVWVERGDEVLFVRDKQTPDVWTLPGGAIDRNEWADQAGRREVREETGVACDVSSVLFATRQTTRTESRPDLEGVLVCFAAEYVDGTLTPQPDEIHECDWRSSVPDATDDVTRRAAALAE